MIEIPGAPQSIDADEERETFSPIRGNLGAHHLLWLNCLQQVEDGKIKRLLGLMPPGSGKSIFTSVVFPTHYLGRNINKNIILASYGSDLPKKLGRRARAIVNQPIFRRIFDCTLSSESSAADEWALTNGSEWMAAGILTGITGNRADGVIWDDLIKGRQEADSEVTRQNTWEAYMDDLMTRKKPNAWEVGVNTRWHEDDPAGRILPLNYNGESGWIKGQDGNDWYVVCLQAICERSDDPLGRKVGEILWPEWFNPEHFAPYQRQPRTWSALYQQRPAPESGEFFKAEWLKTYDKMPPRETLTVYGASDYAVTQDGGDYTVHVVVGVDQQHHIYVLDLWRQQASSDKWIDAFCGLVERWRPLGWAEESGQINAGVGPFLVERLRRRQLYIARAQFPTRQDKATRAQSIRGRMSMDGLYCPFAAPWFSAFKGELMSFPAGRHDDQVDALGLIGQILDKMVQGKPLPEAGQKPKILSTNAEECTVTLNDLWEANERRSKRGAIRIH